MTALCSTRSHMKYSRTRCAMFHDTSTAATPRIPFSNTRGALSPSTPNQVLDVEGGDPADPLDEVVSACARVVAHEYGESKGELGLRPWRARPTARRAGRVRLP